MKSNRIGHRVVALAGGVALITIGTVIAGCTTNQNQAPSSTTTTTTTTTTAPPSTTAPPPPPPTEKGLNPSGGNLFTPQVIAPPAPTEPPGVHRHRAG